MYGIIGKPLGHSSSAKYFTEKFKNEGIQEVFRNFEIDDPKELRELVLKYPDLKGVNVTIPYKQSVIPLLDELSEEAREIGAVNCIKIIRKTGEPYLKGYNTDSIGFKQSLESFFPYRAGDKALILGNGGVAKAVRYVLQTLGIESITVSRKVPEHSTFSIIPYNKVGVFLKDCRLIVNCTPVGMMPNTDESPLIPYEMLNSGHYLFDLIANPEITTFLKKGENQGAHIQNGMATFLAQAKAGWNIWNEKA
ncbi:MAG: shikimate dehydrogenase [Culturomica sp.]|jgi:shikimate dehydrogenase|nr:shikimate dehydrogenase [Culturomica sp.]